MLVIKVSADRGRAGVNIVDTAVYSAIQYVTRQSYMNHNALVNRYWSNDQICNDYTKSTNLNVGDCDY